MNIVTRIAITAALALTASSLSSGPALAFTSHDHGTAKPDLEVASGPAARPYRAVEWDRTPNAAKAAWTRFVSDMGGSWEALWDTDTGVPLRIMGSGVLVPGSVNFPDRAERHVKALLERHIDLFAPGNRADDFVVVSNHLDDRGMRTIGMTQHHAGLSVLGGQVSFRFKNDRLFVIGSESLPAVTAARVAHTLDPAQAKSSALAWMRGDADQVWTTAVEGPYVLPIVAYRSASYHTVMRVTVEARAPMGRWHVYVDAATGEPVARKQTLLFADGTLIYRVPRRRPGGSRLSVPARDTNLTVDSVDVVSDVNGLVTWPGPAAAMVATSVVGQFVRTRNADDSPTASVTLVLPDGGTAEWDPGGNEFDHAQTTTYIHSRIVKDYCRTFASDLEFLDNQLLATVNIDDTCNAFSDGVTINFFRSSESCENTGRLPDVVYHEFGHALHRQSLIEGVGAFDGAFSEGLSDYLASTINDDPGMGRGFFYDNDALRHIDPTDMEHRWPEDIREIHYTGLIFAGAMWDLRKELIAAHGEEAGVAQADRLFYAAVQRATDIPSTYVEVLAADDDDGDLSNGTPNECMINYTFGSLHGLRNIRTDYLPIGAQPPERDGYELSFRVTGTTDRCAGDDVVSVQASWGLRGVDDGTPNQIDLVDTDGLYTGAIPQQEAGSVVRYSLQVELADGTRAHFPANLADQEYEFYVGEVVELYCNDFEGVNPFTDGWSHELPVSEEPDDDDWEWGAPMIMPGSVDPTVAYSGSNVVGTDLGYEGGYGYHRNNLKSFALTPAIPIENYSDVRLHYRRWLTVEDALYDHARIYANDQEAWDNAATESGTIHHLDAEWVFHDVPVSEFITTDSVVVKFELETDQGLQFGGWTIDDFCVVANPNSICGDGAVAGAEECDDASGNSDTADACRTNCRVSTCGDDIVDSNEQCDGGEECNDDCTLIDTGGCGCAVGRADRTTAYAPLAALWLVCLLIVRRRRERRSA